MRVKQRTMSDNEDKAVIIPPGQYIYLTLEQGVQLSARYSANVCVATRDGFELETIIFDKQRLMYCLLPSGTRHRLCSAITAPAADTRH